MNFSDTLNNLVNWDFLNEPLYRWFIFLAALSFMLYAWHGILEFMK